MVKDTLSRSPFLLTKCIADTISLLYYTILYYTILYYTILYYTILYYTTILYYYKHCAETIGGGANSIFAPPAPIGRLGVHAPLAPILYYTIHFAPMLLGERTRFSPPPKSDLLKVRLPSPPHYTILYKTILLYVCAEAVGVRT